MFVNTLDLEPETIRIILLAAIPVGIVQLILMISAVVSIAKKRLPLGDKIIWYCIAIFVNLFGPILYFAFGANMLEQKAVELEEQNEREENY